MALSELLDFTGLHRSEPSKLHQRLEELNTHTLSEIMTPRSIVHALDVDVQLRRVRRLRSSKAAYFPVYKGDLDHVIGWISKDRVIELLELPGDTADMRQYLRPVGSIPDTTPVANLLEEFLKARSPFLVVTGRDGQTEGVISLNEFVELLFGFELNQSAISSNETRPAASIDRF